MNNGRGILAGWDRTYARLPAAEAPGTSLVALTEEDTRLHTYPFLSATMGRLFDFPIYRDGSVKTILLKKRIGGELKSG